MKALSIKQPWASLIAHGIKDIENRTWRTHFRGRIFIHASADKKQKPNFTREQNNAMYNYFMTDGIRPKTFSAIIGEVDIIDCVINHSSIWAEKTIQFEAFETQKPIYNWVLANAKLYDKPILNVKGKLSFWYPDVDIVECVGCGNKFDSETMREDDEEEKFCIECFEELFPIYRDCFTKQEVKQQL